LSAPSKGYCIYKDGLSSDLSVEHVIPLSLGGHNGFTVPADRVLNNTVAAKLDGAVANDFLVLFDRRDADSRGYSGQPPLPRAKRSELDGRPVQVSFGQDGLSVFDARDRRVLDRGEFGGKEVKVGGIRIGLDDSIRFVAKVALSAGYFTYGEAFRQQVDHEQARLIMMADDLETINPNVRLWERWQPVEDEAHRVFWLMTSQRKESTVILTPSPDSLGVSVGILGTFMGFINIPAPGHQLVNDGDYRMGHVIAIQDGALLRRSFRSALDDYYSDIEEPSEGMVSALSLLEKINQAGEA